jgi:hypothetical protein
VDTGHHLAASFDAAPLATRYVSCKKAAGGASADCRGDDVTLLLPSLSS